jgi:hypothetical protein
MMVLSSAAERRLVTDPCQGESGLRGQGARQSILRRSARPRCRDRGRPARCEQTDVIGVQPRARHRRHSRFKQSVEIR